MLGVVVITNDGRRGILTTYSRTYGSPMYWGVRFSRVSDDIEEFLESDFIADPVDQSKSAFEPIEWRKP